MSKYYTLQDRFDLLNKWKNICKKLSNDTFFIGVSLLSSKGIIFFLLLKKDADRQHM